MTETQPQDQYRPIGSPPAGPPPPSGSQQPGQSGFFDQLRSFGVRRSSDRWIAGVAGGLARRLGVDPLLVRAGFIALLLFGIGFLAYLIAWALLPDDKDSIVAERALKEGDGWGVFLLVVIALSVIGVGPLFSGGDGWWSLLMTLAVIAGIWWLVTRHGGASTPGGAPPGGEGPAAAAPGPDAAQPVWAPATARPSGYEPPQSTPPPPPQGAARASGAHDTPKAPRAGFAGFLLALGAAVVGYGIGQLIGAVGSAPVGLVSMLCAAAAAGVATMALGLLGRRSGLSGLLSVILAVALLGTWGDVNAPEGGGPKTWQHTEDTPISEYEWTAGQATLDLMGITERPQEQDITARVSMGQLVILVPEDITTRVISNASLGSVTVDGTGDSASGQTEGGLSVTTDHVFGEAAEPDLTVRADVSLGSIRIIAPPGDTPADPS